EDVDVKADVKVPIATTAKSDIPRMVAVISPHVIPIGCASGCAPFRYPFALGCTNAPTQAISTPLTTNATNEPESLPIRFDRPPTHHEKITSQTASPELNAGPPVRIADCLRSSNWRYSTTQP